MTVHARQLADHTSCPPSYFRVRAGLPCDATFELFDNLSGAPVDWSGHGPRFRIYSQLFDRVVVVEITDPQRCSFGPDGIWRLRMTADQTELLPRGGMHFTLEHCDSDGHYLLGVHGGVSCCEENSMARQDLPSSLARSE